MANTVIAIRSSGVSGNSPSLGVLANGELSLNFADGILYYKTSANTLGSIYKVQPSGLDTEIQFNDGGSFGGNSSFTYNKTTGYFKAPIIESTNNGNGTNFKIGDDAWIGDINIADTLRIKGQQNSTKGYIVFGDSDGAKLGRSGTGALTYEGNFVANGELSSLNSNGNEGGQLNLALAQTNTTLNGSVVMDIYQNRLRFYESGGTNRGAYIDLTAATGGVGFNLLSGGGGGGSTNSFGTILANGVSIVADQANEQVEFVGESGIYTYANTTTNKVVIAGTPGAQGLTVDYGWVTEAINYSIDYGTL